MILIFPRVEWPTTRINLIKCQIPMFFFRMIYDSFDDGKESIVNFSRLLASSKNRLLLSDLGWWLSVNCWGCWSFVLFRWKKMLTYPLKWMAAVFLKEIVVIYHSSLRLKNQQLDQVGPTLKSIYHFRYFSIPSPEGNDYSTRKTVSCITDILEILCSSYVLFGVVLYFSFRNCIRETLWRKNKKYGL